MARVTFAYSRNPIDSLKAADDPRWFERHAPRAEQELVRTLSSHPDVERVELHHTDRARRDALGRYATSLCQLELVFRDQPPITASGSGHAGERPRARVIAFAELLERLALRIHGRADGENWSSNGACFHSSALAALKGAVCELLERDAFLTSWYAGRALPATDATSALATRFARTGWRLREHAWKHDKVDAACVYLSAIRRQPRADGWNFFLGCGAAPSHREAVAKATNELLRMFRTFQADYDRLDHSARVTPEALANTLSRLVIYQQPAYIRELERMTSARARRFAVRPRSDRAFVVHCLRELADLRIVPLPVPIQLHEHVFCIKAASAQLQDIDWAIPPQFNLARIRERYRTRRDRLNSFPHPIA
jgi:ribosomal protein S12 methylthiotransferase accessory factor YcaO-like protein